MAASSVLNITIPITAGFSVDLVTILDRTKKGISGTVMLKIPTFPGQDACQFQLGELKESAGRTLFLTQLDFRPTDGLDRCIWKLLRLYLEKTVPLS